MATRAFLLCGDEKAVQAVTQILDELEVSFEHSSEPGFSLKRLATQRFDLLIVDCDNAQNATQVFNSARASALNKASIAIAIVEGKAGVPNAFRLGASLVLTKPVSLEQARNTLRTGIGMTRRDAVETKPAAPAVTVPTVPVVAPVSSVPAPANVLSTTPVPVRPVTPPVATPAVLTPVAPAPPAPKPLAETPKAVMAQVPATDKPAASARPAMIPVMPPQEPKPAISASVEGKGQPLATAPSFAKAASAGADTSATAPKNFDSVFKMPAQSDAIAKQDTPKLEVAKTNAPKSDGKSDALKAEAPEKSDTDSPTLSIVDPLAEEEEVLDPVKNHGVPSFGAIGRDSFAGSDNASSGRSRGWLIAAVLLLLLGGAGYGAWATQPEFQKFVVWEYSNTMSQIAGLRGHSQPVASQPLASAPMPAAPTPAPVQPSSSEPATTASVTTDPANAATPAAGATTTPASAQPNSPAETTATKTASVQPAKQETNAAHPVNPALVPASLPATPTAKAPSNELLEVPEDFADDQVVHRVHPMYPKQARIRKVQGTVVLEAIVNKKGAVDSLQLVSGDALLAQAAADAVKQWKYKPYFHNNEPTEFQTRITIDFKLP